MTTQKAIELLDNLIVFDNDHDEALKMAIEALTKPEIVRCEDCKHRQPDEQKYMCVLTITEQNCKQVYMKDNDYCSFGERKEEE